MDASKQLEIYFGRTTATEARIYAEYRGPGCSEIELAGSVHGPECETARTLPMSTRFVLLPPGETALAEARVPDPCFWTPDGPYRYEVEVEVRHSGEPVLTHRQELGIRPLGVRGADFLLEGRRWVLRGVWRDDVSVGQLSEFREAAAALVSSSIMPHVWKAAGRKGVLCAAILSSAQTNLAAELKRLARMPSVAMVFFRDGMPDIAPRNVPRNLILGQALLEGEAVEPDAKARAVVCRAEVVRHQHLAAGVALPLLVYRPCDPSLPVAAAREECDTLQRDLASLGDFAGYIV